jgi:hypothetical protein
MMGDGDPVAFPLIPNWDKDNQENPCQRKAQRQATTDALFVEKIKKKLKN